VQLEARQLDGKHVVAFTGGDRVDDRRADVADGGGAQPGGTQDRFQHPDGGRLAVRTGDREPRCSRVAA